MSDAIIYEVGREYWTIAKRFHANRQFQGMKPIIVNDMLGLLRTTKSEAVRRRINSFVARHSPLPPRPVNPGPRFA